jgi:regulator of sigma E protease
MDANVLGLLATLIALTAWHETGHWLAARAVRVPVRRVSVGLGPVVWQHALRRDTDLVLRALPLGMSIAAARWRASP